MKVDKAKILEQLRRKGLDDRATFVDRQLPDVVDLETNSGLLKTLGIDVAELVGQSS
ncbi:hypothetical protein F4553_003734 [Allocatelliglobosispora scoriae]|uniref:Uncharacterized protein n=1 Tax=Allocatelliglobosispora scoriae TaxID=643052 RepID=A0A841BRM0_9ACTN|nr:hypothetical protein [Allocatelliglobosispora scoriae]MBB5870355.1 hypothetical protein [Allocatelliglobosispora scoriae]